MSDAINQEKLEFISLLENDEGRACFMGFLETNYTEHHLIFWEEVKDYRKLTDAAAIKAAADALFKKFVKAGTKLQINVTDMIKAQIEDDIKAGATLVVFDEAERICMDLMKGNQYHPFMKTPEYIAWKKKEDNAGKKSGTCNIL